MAIDTVLIRWRVVRKLQQEINGHTIGQLVGYVDGRQVMSMLDDLDPDWSVYHEPVTAGDELVGVQATLTVKGINRSDVGVPSNQDPVKGAYSDALKRAAVHFGIGRELYELPQVYAELTQVGRNWVPAQKPKFNEDTGRWEIDAPGWVWYPEEETDPAPKVPVKGTVGVDKKEEIKRLARRLGMNKDMLISFARGSSKIDLANMDDADMDKLIAALTAAAVEASTGGKLE